MNIPEAVIQKFFRGACTDEEERQVRLYFIEYPGELEKYMTEESWEVTSDYPMPDALTASMLKRIETETSLRVFRMKPMQWVAAAAVAVLLAGGFLLWQVFPGKQRAMVAAAGIKKDSLVKQENTSRDTMFIAMQDGSSVTLEPNSSVAYYQPFRNNSRDLYLKGNGLFRVKNSKVQPFTVHTAQVATTALGTSFRVREDKGGKVSVRLYSGKVKVQAVSTEGKGLNSSAVTYLDPGQELVVAVNGNPIVRTFDERPAMKATTEKKAVTAPAVVTFKDEPLNSVLAQLQRSGSIRIRFSEEDVADMTFTGVYNPAKETADNFLETLVLLNGLTIRKENNIYYINR
ncbi:FecR family protein [Filimonas effusa]|uniref:DUF4974 domain-containing protein n=1 Tax=Filimonas effusa TaxID=2508721 RepID=A0A4Q1D430_9BACT|nr:FecR domain-containing protein [Filimonas effusa]RXK83098.1 DUF4974 domain-containing protein [Filimonas effusa]